MNVESTSAPAIRMMTRRTAADGTETWMQLLSKKALRKAMAVTAGTDRDCSSIPKLALRAGLSNATVGFLVAEGKSSRTTCTVETAQRIADALDWPRDALFS